MTKLEDWITCCHSVKVLKSAGIDSMSNILTDKHLLRSDKNFQMVRE